MPLKEIDLKTFEAYKKAIRSDVTRITDSSKTKFWVYKDIELPDAQGKKQKIAAFIALVDDMGIRGPLRSKKLLCSGLCHLEGGKVSFEPIKGKVPYLQLKKSVPLFLGKPLYIPADADENDEGGEGVEDEQEERPTQPVGSATTPPQQPDPAVASLWAKLEPQIHTAIAADPARKDVLTRAAVAIVEAIKTNNSAEAMKRMEAMKVLLASAPPGKAGGPDPAALKEEWGKLVPRIKAAGNAALTQAAADAGKQLGDLVSHGKLAEAQTLIDQIAARLANLKPADAPKSEGAKLAPQDIAAAWQKLAPEAEKKSRVHPEVKEAALRARKQAEELTKAGKLDAAKGVLDELAKYLSGISEEASQKESEAQEKPEPEDPRKAEYERRWAKMEGEAEAALKEQRGDVSRIRAAVALAGERAEGGDYASALKVLDGLDKLLEVVDADEDDTPPPGLVEYRKKLLKFENARRTVDAQIEKLAAVIPQTVQGEDDVADSLSAELEEELEEIQDLIDEAINAAQDERAPANASLKGKLENSVKELLSSKLFEMAESNPFGVSVEIRKPLSAALKEIVDAMPVTA